MWPRISPLQFIPNFLTQSKTRIKELRRELSEMPSALTSDNEAWEAYRAVISQVEVELKEVLVSGSETATMNIVPDVTFLYRKFAEDIRKVRDFNHAPCALWVQGSPGEGSWYSMAAPVPTSGCCLAGLTHNKLHSEKANGNSQAFGHCLGFWSPRKRRCHLCRTSPSEEGHVEEME